MSRFPSVLFLGLMSGSLLWETPNLVDLPDGLRSQLYNLGFGKHRRGDELAHLGIDQWPNKRGPVKTTFAFRPEDYPHLRGYVVRSGGPERFWLEKGPSSVTIEIEILPSNDDAQQRLVNRVTSTSFPIAPLLRTGRRFGPNLGDVCLTPYDPRTYPPAEWQIFDFVRSNVRVQVYGSHDNDVNAWSLAHAIDERIKQSR